MALPPLAPLDELEARLGVDLEGSAADRAEAMLRDASAVIRAEASLDWIDDDGNLEAVPDLVVTICVAVAYRAYQNPEGAAQMSTGDASISFGRVPPGAVYLTPAEQRMIRQLAGNTGLRTVQLESGLSGGGDPYYVPVQGGGDPFPIGPFPWEV